MIEKQQKLSRTELWVRGEVRREVDKWFKEQTADIYGEFYGYYRRGAILICKETPVDDPRNPWYLMGRRITPDMNKNQVFSQLMRLAMQSPCLPLKGVE